MDDLEQIYRVFDIEIEALIEMKKTITVLNLDIISLISDARGKIVFLGVGKMGNVALKSASTFSSLGIPSIYLSPLEANHGGLGVFQNGDIAILLSKSGKTKELISLIPFLKTKGIPIIGVTGNADSVLYKESNYCQFIPDVREACIYNLAPTSSTTMTMCYFDALAITISKKKKFQKEDFLNQHPGGTLGKLR